MSLLSSILDDTSHRHPLTIVQSSIAQSGFPLVAELVSQRSRSKTKPSQSPSYTLLFCLLYSSTAILEHQKENIQLCDWTDRIPTYNDGWSTIQQDIISAIEKAPAQPLTVVIDSVDTLLSDIGSISETYAFISNLYELLRGRSKHSSLILHIVQPSDLTPLLVQTAFSSSLVHLTAHPPLLLEYIATEYLTPPPPVSTVAKFWSVFPPVSERGYDVERLVFGPRGEGSGNPFEMVVEVLVRDAGSRKRGIERILEGWSSVHGPCEIGVLESLKNLQVKQIKADATPDPTQNISFNLGLTSSQQESRAKVPLPYVHEGKPTQPQELEGKTGAIFYDPDSADDIDDDDPDEDLDI